MGAVFSKSLFLSKLVAVGAASSVAFAGSPAIGIVTATGHFIVERSEVWGNSTLFDGTTVETGSASSELSLRNGVKMQLGVASRARVWENRLVIEKGVGQVAAPASYEVDAGGLKIHGTNDSARLRVGMSDRVEVTALNGSAKVASSGGVLLAAIPAGRSMSFSMQAAASGAVSRTGCLLYKDGHFILQDENTQEVVELNGKDLGLNVGNRVEVSGTTAATKPAINIATLVINVTSVAPKSQGGCLSVASALDAKTEAPAGTSSGTTPASAAKAPKPTGGGLSTGAKVGIAAAAVGGGVGAALALSGKKSSTSP